MPKYGTSARIQDVDVYLEYEIDETRTYSTLTNVNIGGDSQNVIDIGSESFLSDCCVFVNGIAWERGQLID